MTSFEMVKDGTEVPIHGYEIKSKRSRRIR